MTMTDADHLVQLTREIYSQLPPGLSADPSDKPLPTGRDTNFPADGILFYPFESSGFPPTFTAPYYFLADLLPNNPLTVEKPSPGISVDPYAVRKDFPILKQTVHGKPLIWLDNAATTQKPECVIEALRAYYLETNSNIHRGSHFLANQATDAYETARKKTAQFIGASSVEEIIFVRGTTEAINLVAQTYGRMVLKPNDQILLSIMEHHSNIVPWQLLGQATGAVIRAIPIDDRGMLKLDDYEKLLQTPTKLVAVTHVSNVLGTINPIRQLIEMAHHYGARILIDGAQSAPHFSVNLRELDADFYAFSGHKLYGPTGIGVLYGKRELLEEMPPWQGGGNMIKEVSFEHTTYNQLPHKFEAGTANIAGAVGLGAAIDYLQRLGLEAIHKHERVLTAYAHQMLTRIPGLRIIGTATQKTSVISFVVQSIASDKLARYLDQAGIAVRSGHHCAQPVLRHFGLDGSLRLSLGLYNTKDEIDKLVEVILNAV